MWWTDAFKKNFGGFLLQVLFKNQEFLFFPLPTPPLPHPTLLFPTLPYPTLPYPTLPTTNLFFFETRDTINPLLLEIRHTINPFLLETQHTTLSLPPNPTLVLIHSVYFPKTKPYPSPNNSSQSPTLTTASPVPQSLFPVKPITTLPMKKKDIFKKCNKEKTIYEKKV